MKENQPECPLHKDKDHYFILIIILKDSVKCLSNNM